LGIDVPAMKARFLACCGILRENIGQTHETPLAVRKS
jgi:hypothetical protein